MSEYGYDEKTEAVDAPPDPRIVAVHRVVDLEQQAERMQMEADRAAKKAAVVSNELREARDVLSGLLGYPSNSGVKAMSRDEFEAEMKATAIAMRSAR